MKRGDSGLSFLLALNKPAGPSSHDMVNALRRAVGERRVGHAGTLDPFASGALLMMAGPATRLDRYLVGHAKTYLARIAFGASTDTEDCTGSLIDFDEPSLSLLDPIFAEGVIRSFLGKSLQIPPTYSAIKSHGRKSCDVARNGKVIEHNPRAIEVFAADLIEVGEIDSKYAGLAMGKAELSRRDGSADAKLFDRYPSLVFWDVRFKVSSGTYIRSLARDIGVEAGCPAHLAALERSASGRISLDECISANRLDDRWEDGMIDPVFALGLKTALLDESASRRVDNGRPIDVSSTKLMALNGSSPACACTSIFSKSDKPLSEGELVSMIVDNELKAIYKYDGAAGLVPDCVFNVGVTRGNVV